MPYEFISVLIVDDSKIMRRIIAKRLQEMGFADMYEASGVKPALKVLEEVEVNLILCDWSMPGLTGMDLLRMVRGNERRP